MYHLHPVAPQPSGEEVMSEFWAHTPSPVREYFRPESQATRTSQRLLPPPNSSCPLRSHLLGRVASRTIPPSLRYDQFEG